MTYILPIQVAFIIFSILGFFLIIPWMIYSYRKYGFFSLWTSLIVYSFSFYMLSALFLVLLPLPTTRNTCALQSPDTVYYSLAPFSFIRDTFKGSAIVWSQPTTYIQLFKQSAFLQAAFNFILLLPLGVYLRYFLQEKRYWKRAFGLGFALSLFYEITQLTGIYGLYTCPYRIFDVDDLILNSTGALFGFLIAPVILALFPSKKSVLAKKEKILKENVVSPLARLLAVIIDFLVIGISWSLTIGLFTSSRFIEIIFTTIGFLVVFFILPVFWGGKTLGTNMMGYKLISTVESRPSWQAFLKRCLALYLPWVILTLLNVITGMKIDINSDLYPYHVWVSLVAFIFVFIMWSVLFIHAILVIFRKDNRPFYFDYVANLTLRKK